jgi:hypothetical protein
VREAIVTLDGGRNKFTVFKDGTDPGEYKEVGCSVKPRFSVPNSADQLGFATFVYRARRPFNYQRLTRLFDRWSLHSKDIKLDLSQSGNPKFGKADEAVLPPGKDITFLGVFRSKGTAWLDGGHTHAAVWSHAGRQLRFIKGGAWWATVPEQVMRQCLPKPEAYAAEFANFEGEDGDRRQEIVFIGTKMDEARITTALDECLCRSDEINAYRTGWAQVNEQIKLKKGPFRFSIGARVECSVGDGNWSAGTVTAHFYHEDAWEPEIFSPYQIALDDDGLIHAPADVNECIRAL